MVTVGSADTTQINSYPTSNPNTIRNQGRKGEGKNKMEGKFASEVRAGDKERAPRLNKKMKEN